MKHTKNTHNVFLDLKKTYTILQEHKGQKLILIKGENPAQRWVDTECFSKENISTNPLNVSRVECNVIPIDKENKKPLESTVKTKYSKKYENNNTKKYETGNISSQNILSLSWHNAFCETHRYKKECKRSVFSFGRPNYGDKHFVLHGLWPKPKNNLYCGVEKHYVILDKHKQWNRLPHLELSDETRKRLQKFMPGYASDLHKHEWIKHGTCYGANANRYYQDALNMVEQINHSKVGDFFKKHIGKQVTLSQVRAAFDRSFGTGTGKHVAMQCENGLITELRLHMGSGSDHLGVLLQRGETVRSHCHSGMVDKVGYKENER